MDPDISTALQRLIFVCPEYADVWRGERAKDFVEGIWPPAEYVETAGLADWVVQRVTAKDYSCFEALFAEVEDLLSNGSTEVRQLLTIGLIEDIQHGLGEGQTTIAEADELLRFLRPATRASWDEVRSWFNRPTA